MALSKDTVRPYWPKKLEHFVVEKEAADGAGFTPGTVVVEVSGNIVGVDLNESLHLELPCYMVWTDGSTRVDIEYINSSGTTKEMYTCLAGQFKADVLADTTLFVSAPVAGDTLVKSDSTSGGAAGKMEPLNSSELASRLGTDVENYLSVLGRVEGDARSGDANFVNCSFDLG